MYSFLVLYLSITLLLTYLLPPISATPWSTNYVTIGKYPGTTGYPFYGALEIFTSSNYLLIRGQLTDLEPNVQGGAHVHAGYSCATTSDPGGHWYAPSDGVDVWNNIKYTSDATGNAWFEAAITSEALGKDPTKVSNHVFVLHNSAGTKIGCGVIKLVPMLTATIKPYPGYTGKSGQNITGFVSVKELSGGIEFQPILAGVPKSSSGGVHIHTGYTCEDASAVGGHLFNSTGNDPWKGPFQPKFHSNASGFSYTDPYTVGGFSFINNDYPTILGRAVVVHNSTGARIGCGILGNNQQTIYQSMYSNNMPYTVTTTPTPAPTKNQNTNTFPWNNLAVGINTYPGLTGYKYYGKLQVVASSEYLIIRGQLTGLEPNVQGGAHVHAGYSCANSNDPGGHWYSGNDDIWNNIMYTSDGDGNAWFEAAISTATLGKDPTLVSNHAFVLHSSSGSRIGCGVIKPIPALFAKITAYPGSTEFTGISGLVSVNQFLSTTNGMSYVSLNADVAGLPKSTTGGFHIHVGFTCEDASVVGGHLYTFNNTDPWNNVDTIYESNDVGFSNSTTSAASFVLFDMYNSDISVLGRAIVLHSNSGTRIGCGIIGNNEQITYQGMYSNNNPYTFSTPAPTPATQTTYLSSISTGKAIGISIGFSLLFAFIIAGAIGAFVFRHLKARIDSLQEGQVTFELPDISKVAV